MYREIEIVPSPVVLLPVPRSRPRPKVSKIHTYVLNIMSNTPLSSTTHSEVDSGSIDPSPAVPLSVPRPRPRPRSKVPKIRKYFCGIMSRI